MPTFDSIALEHMVLPVVWLVSGLVAGYIVEKIVLKKLRKAAQETSWGGDDIILDSLKGVMLFFFSLLGVSMAVKSYPGASVYEATIEKTVTAILILVGTVVLARIATGLVKMYSQRIDSGFLSTSIFANLAKMLILILGALMILQHLNISITPILTALGVGGLAVALALQDTLANLFAGLHIIASKQLLPGDYIKLSSGEEGVITDITWRYTNIRALSNTITIIPNAHLAKAIVTNYDLPEKELAVLIEVGVDYSSDLEKVEKVTMEEAAAVMNDLEGGVTAFAPFIRYHTFDDSSINFTVILRGRQFVDQYLIKHEFIKRLHRRYNREDIRIPFPIRTVHLERDKDTRKEA
jgi:small-conductance mechanosensitive channel